MSVSPATISYIYFSQAGLLSATCLLHAILLIFQKDVTLKVKARESVCVCVCVCVCTQSCPTLCNLMDCSPPGSSVHGIFQARNTGVSCHFLPRWSFQSRDELCLLYLPHWQAESLSLVPPGKPSRESSHLIRGNRYPSQTSVMETDFVSISPSYV